MARAPSKDQIAFLETTDFLAVMKDYALESGKDFAEAINLKMRDAALKAAQRAPRAIRGDIDAAFTPKIVAGKLKRKPLHGILVRYTRKYKDGRSVVRYRTRQRHYSREEAYLYHQAVTGRRKRSINFLKSFYIGLAAEIEKKCPSVPATARKHKPGHSFTYVPATPEKPEATGQVEYVYRKAKRAQLDHILQKWWNVGLGMAILDAQQYIERKMRERAAKYSIR